MVGGSSGVTAATASLDCELQAGRLPYGKPLMYMDKYSVDCITVPLTLTTTKTDCWVEWQACGRHVNALDPRTRCLTVQDPGGCDLRVGVSAACQHPTQPEIPYGVTYQCACTTSCLVPGTLKLVTVLNITKVHCRLQHEVSRPCRATGQAGSQVELGMPCDGTASPQKTLKLSLDSGRRLIREIRIRIIQQPTVRTRRDAEEPSQHDDALQSTDLSYTEDSLGISRVRWYLGR